MVVTLDSFDGFISEEMCGVNAASVMHRLSVMVQIHHWLLQVQFTGGVTRDLPGPEVSVATIEPKEVVKTSVGGDVALARESQVPLP